MKEADATIVLEVDIDDMVPVDAKGEPPVPCHVETPCAHAITGETMSTPDR